MNDQTSNHHIPVLLDEVVRLLDPKSGEAYLDLTAGYGGHARVIISKIGDAKKATLVDRDIQAIVALKEFEDKGAQLIKSDFLSASQELLDSSQSFDMIFLDLGISSPHVDNAERGFSLKKDGPLDMRMDQEAEVSAANIVNKSSQDALANILYEYGQEPRSRRVASAIVKARPINTTTELAEVVRRALPGPRLKVHPATKTFQAIRIAVNQELDQIEQTMPLALDLLKPGGRLAVISFHSLEDRIVKTFFKEESQSGYESTVEVLTKKPVSGTDDVFNPRARSAKLRVALKKPVNL